MQTPISFILDLILDYELPADAQKACRKYVRELEKQMVSKPPVVAPIVKNSLQAPSTQKLLDEMAAQTGAPIINPIPVAQRIVGGEVNTGGGTKGPRKW
jgi:hypothetical protein